MRLSACKAEKKDIYPGTRGRTCKDGQTSANGKYTIAVAMAVRIHLFSFRTQKLSSLAPTILCGRPHGKIGSCRFHYWPIDRNYSEKSAAYCPLAQSVEHSAVNRSVVSSSLSGAAITFRLEPLSRNDFLCLKQS